MRIQCVLGYIYSPLPPCKIVMSSDYKEEEIRRLGREMNQFEEVRDCQLDEWKRLSKEKDGLQQQLETTTDGKTLKQLLDNISLTKAKIDLSHSIVQRADAKAGQRAWEQAKVRGDAAAEDQIKHYKKEAEERGDKVKKNEEVVKNLEKKREQYGGDKDVEMYWQWMADIVHSLKQKAASLEEENISLKLRNEQLRKSVSKEATWDLRGVDVCGEMTVVVLSSCTQQITWEGYGLKLHFDEGSLPTGIDQCTLSIKASLAGQYEFLENSYLVSAIFWLRCEPMCKFTKPVTVEMQHCARSENVTKLNLKFVKAVCSQKQLLYTFKELGGEFTCHSSYGVIEVNGFSGLAITQQGSEEREYCSQLFYIGHPNCCHIHFVVTWNIEAYLTMMKEEYDSKCVIYGLHQPLDFESDRIILDIPLERVSIKGWNITPLMRPVVTKKQVDNYIGSKLTPCCQLKAEVSENGKTASIMKHQVIMNGAKYPNDIFIIDLPARGHVVGLNWTGMSPLHIDPIATRLNSHHLSSLLRQLYEHATRWKDIGGELGFMQGELDTTQAKPALLTDAPRSWLRSMLSDWLEWAPGDGRGSTHFATLERLKDALRQANLGATADTLHL